MSRRYMSKTEHNAIVAGLRALQRHGGDSALLTDGDVAAITDGGIDALIEAIQFDEVQMQIVGKAEA